ELTNRDGVFDHARDFTERIKSGELPLVDTEPLTYASDKYGVVTFLKVAYQLHDAAANLHGWAVALLIRNIDWDTFQRDVEEKIGRDKLWSVYAASYDRVLLNYPPYGQLIDDVIALVPRKSSKVADLGAGTGNVTAALLRAGHRVTAVEE